MALLFLAGCHSFTTVHIVNTSITMVKNEEAIDLYNSKGKILQSQIIDSVGE